jgi:hypothetical protein
VRCPSARPKHRIFIAVDVHNFSRAPGSDGKLGRHPAQLGFTEPAFAWSGPVNCNSNSKAFHCHRHIRVADNNKKKMRFSREEKNSTLSCREQARYNGSIELYVL